MFLYAEFERVFVISDVFKIEFKKCSMRNKDLLLVTLTHMKDIINVYFQPFLNELLGKLTFLLFVMRNKS